MSEIRYVKGDATRPEGTGNRIIAHICNDIGAWGCGFTRALSKRWRRPEEEYREWYSLSAVGNFGLGMLQLVSVEPGILVANMIAQHCIGFHSGVPPIRYEALRDCLRGLARRAMETQSSVHMPRIGCGLAGGRWEEIEPIILDELVSHGIDVTVYELA